MPSSGYQYHGQVWSDSGCAGTQMAPGWYQTGTYKLVASTYKNPSTGAMYTTDELATLAGGTTTTTPTTTTPAATTTTPAATTTTPTTGLPTTYMSYASWLGAQGLSAQTLPEGSPATMAAYNTWVAGLNKPAAAATTTPAATTAATTTAAIPAITPLPMPSYGSINVPAPTVTPAPAYEISPEQKAWEEKVGGYLTSTLAQGGVGIPAETMALMTQKTTDTLKAKETEDIRVMRNNMERRGITNSGFVFSNEQKIRSGTTMAIANSITDLNIQNALMKMASFENAMGQAAQFLGYLGEQSQLKNQPAYQTWAAQQQATLYQYQAKMDLYKTQIQQAYAQNNMILAGQIADTAAIKQNGWDVDMAKMEIEAANKQAMYTGAGSLLGTTIGGIFGLIK